METKEAFAYGSLDSAGKVMGKPIFKEGNDVYNMDSIHYNFDSKKAKIYGVITKQGEGFLHSKMTKKMPDNTVNLIGGEYTTCDLEHPHFYIYLTKAKVIPNKQIITGPAYLVIEDVPLPIGIPFGFFPNRKGRHSGILIPRYGEETNRGFYLQQGGYYFGMSDYYDLALTGSVYSFGGWDLNGKSAYRVRYKYSGSLNLSYVKWWSEVRAIPITWTKEHIAFNGIIARILSFKPNSTFGASVNLPSRAIILMPATIHLAILTVLLIPVFPIAVFLRVRHLVLPLAQTIHNRLAQNRVTISLPVMTFNMSSIYPFKSKNATGKPNVIEKIGISYSSSLQNQYTALEDNLFKGDWETKCQWDEAHHTYYHFFFLA